MTKRSEVAAESKDPYRLFSADRLRLLVNDAFKPEIEIQRRWRWPAKLTAEATVDGLPGVSGIAERIRHGSNIGRKATRPK